MTQSLFKGMLTCIALFFVHSIALSQHISGAPTVGCGSSQFYWITVPGTNKQCQGIWVVNYPNGTVTTLNGVVDADINWGNNPGYGSVSFHGTCTYTPYSNTGNNQPITVTVNQTLPVTIGNGSMPKPSLSTPGYFCYNDTKTVSISSVQNAVSYTYEVPNGWSINGGSNTLTTSALAVFVTSPGSGNSSGILIKVRANGSNCTLPSPYVTKNVRFGSISPTIVGNSEALPNSLNQYFGFNTEGLVGGTWTKPSSWTLITDNGVASQVYQMPAGISSGTITLSGMSCGQAVQATKHVLIAPVDFDIFKSNLTEENGTTVYPNPANEKVTVNAQGTEIKRIVLLNTSGQIILDQSNVNELNVSQVPSGIYFLRSTTTNGEFSVEKIEIRH